MKNQIIIENVLCWMDGGSVTLKLKNNESLIYNVEFVQKEFLKKRENKPFPGSLLLNEKEVEIRSEIEKEILSDLKTAQFGTKIIESEKELLKQIISEAIAFVESENYIEVAKKMGRIK